MTQHARTTTGEPVNGRARPPRSGPYSTSRAPGHALDQAGGASDATRTRWAGDVGALTARFPAHRLFANEVPYAPLDGVLDALASAAADVNRYPDPGASALRQALARQYAVPAEDIVCGTGSVGLLGQLLAVTCGAGDEVVYAWRSFEAYPRLADLAGATSVRVPLTGDARSDLPGMARAITDRTRLVILCNPNNPTGEAIRRDELDRFLDGVPSDLPVLVDEAYREFVRDPEVPDGIDVYRRHPNVVVLRTFSKAYGLAGLRVGYAIARGPVMAALRSAVSPFAVSGPGQAAALASLPLTRRLAARVDEVVAERDRVRQGLLDQGWHVPETHANFVWLAAGQRSGDLADACARAGVLVLPFPGEGVRVTVGLPAANDALLAVTGDHAARAVGGPRALAPF